MATNGALAGYSNALRSEPEVSKAKSSLAAAEAKLPLVPRMGHSTKEALELP